MGPKFEYESLTSGFIESKCIFFYLTETLYVIHSCSAIVREKNVRNPTVAWFSLEISTCNKDPVSPFPLPKSSF